MILSFSRFIMPGYIETNFEQKIKRFEKGHTFQLGDRWKPGMLIHFWTESPRNPGKSPNPFFFSQDEALQNPFRFVIGDTTCDGYLPRVLAVENFKMDFRDIRPDDPRFKTHATDQYDFRLIIGSKAIEYNELQEVAKRDGLTVDQFLDYFNFIRIKKRTTILKGQVIHWLHDSVYDPDTAEFAF